VANLPTAFVARHPAAGEGPVIAIVAEYDALPEIGHACGHNLIAMIAIGAALALARYKAQLPGRLIVLGGPAEEGGGGKQFLVDAGYLKGVDAAMMVHPSSYTVVERGALARAEIDISFEGKPAHASSHPDKGINALDAVIQTFNGINALRQHIRDGARIHGIITNGGLKPNIVPEKAAALFYVRDEDNAYCTELVEKLHRCAQGAALATGATLTFQKIGVDYMTMNTNTAIAQAFARHIESLGYPIEKPEPGLGSTDMGNISWVVPAIHAYIRILEAGLAPFLVTLASLPLPRAPSPPAQPCWRQPKPWLPPALTC
jgi:amidohydrolase